MAWPWNPEIPLLVDQPVYQVTATAAEHAGQGCDLHAALKARPETRPDNNGWRRRYGDHTFALGPLTDAIAGVHGLCAGGTGPRTAVPLEDAVTRVGATFSTLHPGLRTYLEHALERYFEYHESREQELGPLRYIGLSNKWTLRPGSTVMAWGPLYENESGAREIRRLRFDRARAEPTVWADLAAYVAAEIVTDRPVEQVHVTEIGLLDGIERHLVRGATPQQAREGFERAVRPKARSVIEGAVRTPGHDCDSCKFTGGCPDLVPVGGMLRLGRPAAWSRSVSAHDLTQYNLCPSRWYMERVTNLPRETHGSDMLRRGTAVHAWIDSAHHRGVPCSADDLPDPADGEGIGIAEGVLTAEEYRLARPFLRHHVEACPFRAGPLDVVLAERSVHARDDAADVVVVAKPDMLFRRDGALVVREVKTTGGHLPADPGAALDRHLAVAFDLVLLANGLADRYDCARGEVQLEVLTPEGGALFTYATEDPVALDTATARLRGHAGEWAHDTTWATRPGSHCVSCPVRRWCPDRDVHANETLPGHPSIEDEEAPF